MRLFSNPFSSRSRQETPATRRRGLFAGPSAPPQGSAPAPVPVPQPPPPLLREYKYIGTQRPPRGLYSKGFSTTPNELRLKGPTNAEKEVIKAGAVGPLMKNGLMKHPFIVDDIGFMQWEDEDNSKTAYLETGGEIRETVQQKLALNIALIIDYRLKSNIDRQPTYNILHKVYLSREAGYYVDGLNGYFKNMYSSINAAISYYNTLNLQDGSQKLSSQLRLYKTLYEFNSQLINAIMAAIAFIGKQRLINENKGMEKENVNSEMNDDLFEVSEYIAHKLYQYFKVELRKGTRGNWDRFNKTSKTGHQSWLTSIGKQTVGMIGKINPYGGITKNEIMSLRANNPFPIPTDDEVLRYSVSKEDLNKGQYSWTKNAYHRHETFFNDIASLVRNVIRISINIDGVNGEFSGSYGNPSGKDKNEYPSNKGIQKDEDEERALPPNWVRVRDDDSGEFYFFNTKTGEKQWELDKEGSFTNALAAASAFAADSAVVASAPPSPATAAVAIQNEEEVVEEEDKDEGEAVTLPSWRPAAAAAAARAAARSPRPQSAPLTRHTLAEGLQRWQNSLRRGGARNTHRRHKTKRQRTRRRH